MRGKVAERAEDDFGEAPPSGVRARREDRWLWVELIGEVHRMAHRACEDVPSHVRADVESAAMVGLMEAIRDLEAIEPGHFEQYVEARVLEALLAEAAHFQPEAMGLGPWLRPANDNDGDSEPSMDRLLETGVQPASDEHWDDAPAEPSFVPFFEGMACEELPTAENAFVSSYTKAAMRWGLARLDERERLVLRLAYKSGLPLAAIAARLEVSTPRAYQIRVEAERRLARLMRKPPALSQMSRASVGFDWEDDAEEPSQSLAKSGKPTPEFNGS